MDNVTLCGSIEENVSCPTVQFPWKTIKNSLRYDTNGGEIGGDWMRLFDSALLDRDGLVDSVALCG
jgi:hypothetical protein